MNENVPPTDTNLNIFEPIHDPQYFSQDKPII